MNSVYLLLDFITRVQKNVTIVVHVSQQTEEMLKDDAAI